jgi:DNA-binding XRE family transcriptional regulator
MNNLKAVRIGLNITQGELATAAGVSSPAISYIESGQKAPKLDTAYRITAFLNSRGAHKTVIDIFPPIPFVEQAS